MFGGEPRDQMKKFVLRTVSSNKGETEQVGIRGRACKTVTESTTRVASVDAAT